MRATSGFVRLFIRGLAWDAEASGQSFVDTVKTAARARLTDTQRGKVLIAASSGHTSTQFSLPPIGSLAQEDIIEVCSAVLDRCDQLVAATPELTDDQLLPALLALFPSIVQTRPDFSVCR